MEISRYMTPHPLTIRPGMRLPEARDLLHAQAFRHLPVTDEDGRLLGMVSDRDIRSAFPSSILDPLLAREDCARLEQVPVSSIMGHPSVCLPREATLDDALLLFDRHCVGALPVVDREHRVVGIVSTRDVMRAYRRLFGIGEAGSALVLIRDDGRPRVLSRICAALEEHGIACTRVVRIDPREDGNGTYSVRVQTYNLHAVHEALRAAGLVCLTGKPGGEYTAEQKGR
jgi:acetoin utilization protein AcuB